MTVDRLTGFPTDDEDISYTITVGRCGYTSA